MALATAHATVSSSVLPRYIAGVTLAGACVIAYSTYSLVEAPPPWGWLLLGVLGLIAAWFPVKVPGVPVYMSISDTFFITAALWFGPASATVIIAVDSLVISRRRNNTLHQMLFNFASSALALWCGVQVYYWLAGHPPLASGATFEAWMIGPLMCLAAIYFLLNSGLTSIAVALTRGISPYALWRQHFAIVSLNYFASASASFFLILLTRYVGLTAIAAVTPLICICYFAMRSWLGRLEDAQRHVDKVNALYMSTIGAFSSAIEAKDGVTSDHVNRVQAYALGLARALGVNDPLDVQALEAAALLHDTGKLAVPEHVLNKPGKLTPSELETMQAHVDVGADILASIDFPYPVVPIVRAHHENWDGSGYPRGLRGEEIPLGARILSVVDCFDALTSDRPYRAAMSEEEAIDIILDRRGKMYDPHVVDTFLRVYRDIVPRTVDRPELQSAVRRIRRGHQSAAAERAALPAPEATPVDGSDELLAFVSLSRLASRTATTRDVGVMAAGYVRQLAPGATWVLLTIDPVRGGLIAQYASGPAAGRIAELSMDVGQRVSGWVAATWRPMFNAQSQLDLESAAGDLQYALSLPLVAEGRLAGVITLYASEPFSDPQCRRFEMIAPHLAAAVAMTEYASSKSTRDLRVVARR